MNTPTDIYDLPELPDVDVDVNIDLSDMTFLHIEPSMTLDIPLIPPSVNTCFRTYKGRVIKVNCTENSINKWKYISQRRNMKFLKVI